MATAIRSSSVGVIAGTALSVSAPSGTTTGDLVIVLVYCNSLNAISDNNGSTPFTEDLTDFQETNNGSVSSIFSRRTQSGDPTTYNFTVPNERGTAIAICFSDPDPTTIYDVAPTSTNSSAFSFTGSPTSDSITTATNGAFHIVACGMDGAGAADITAVPTDYTQLQNHDGSTGMSFATAYRVIAAAGATGSKSWTVSGSNGAITHSFAVYPKSSSTPKGRLLVGASSGDMSALARTSYLNGVLQ